ncbi:MAG: putative zinc-binding peptidase [Steroidobacteraceae bacterium]
MKVFHCSHCRHIVFFENTQCVNCGFTLAYVPDLAAVVALARVPDGTWQIEPRGAAHRRFRLCRNYSEQNVCNWAVPVEDRNALCDSCRLTAVIPNLARAGHREAWFKLEAAKRRLIYSLRALHCPISSRMEDPERGLAYQFLSDQDADQRVLTGHDQGLITVNVTEANDAAREHQRLQMHEPYRTLLGHFRHEIGHYYWERLINHTARLEPFRLLFGDERADYAAALQAHYQRGPPADWVQRFVSGYAASHPWEDWAESWAHYLHMTDMLDTAADCGLSLNPHRRDEPTLAHARSGTGQPFERLSADWFPLTYLLNNLNRSMGLADGYPFVLSTPALEKLRFVHDTIAMAN